MGGYCKFGELLNIDYLLLLDWFKVCYGYDVVFFFRVVGVEV